MKIAATPFCSVKQSSGAAKCLVSHLCSAGRSMKKLLISFYYVSSVTIRHPDQCFLFEITTPASEATAVTTGTKMRSGVAAAEEV